MTDRDLALALQQAQDVEAATRLVTKGEDIAERDHALNVLRLVIPLRRELETWLALRALRAQLGKPSGVGA